MAEIYSSELLRVVIAQIAQTIGYSNTQSAPLELLEDVLQRFIQELARDLHSQAEHANRVEPNLKDVQLSLNNLSTDVHDLLDYIGNVEPVPFVRDVPEYPVKRNSNLNFLKPGSAETLSRPVHIFEYLPPILPTEPSTSSAVRGPNPSENETIPSATDFRRDIDVKNDLSETGAHNLYIQRDSQMTLKSSSRDNVDQDGHAVREISSVVMTTGGFISPAIEGKLPEAFVPDIIDILKGFDAPPKSPPPETPDVKTTLATETQLSLVETANASKIPSLECKAFSEISTAGAKTDINNKVEANTLALAVSNQPKPTKKNKKKHLIGGLRSDNSMEKDTSKAQEKAHRKALRMFQKLSKNQDVPGGETSGSIKKSIKNLNRGMLSALPEKSTERTHLEKMLKKQTKQRQKQLKSQKQQRQLNLKSSPANEGYPFDSNASTSLPIADPMPTNTSTVFPISATLGASNYTLSTPTKAPSTLIERIDKFAPDICQTSVKGELSMGNDSYLDEIKIANEPDRNKLNIFKKLSKTKTPKASSALPPPSPLPLSLPMTLNIANNLFGNATNSSPLINLPSGTTITPAPAFNNPENVNLSSSVSTYEHKEQSLIGPITPLSPNRLLSADVNRPKKRGRKPGGKNCIRSQTSTEITQKKVKPNKLLYTSNSPVNTTLLHTLPSPSPVSTEPLNLSHIDQLKCQPLNLFTSSVNCGGTIDGSSDVGTDEVIAVPPVEGENMKIKRAKEKKERKKSKVKYNQFDRLDDNQLTDNALELNKKYTFMDNARLSALTHESSGVTERSFNQTSPLKSPGLKRMPITSPPMIGSVHAGFMPGLGALPLLPFPPRPGLIPSAMFSPTSLANFGKKGNCANRMMISNPFTSLPGTDRSALNIGSKSAFVDATETKASGLSVLPPSLSLPESHLERSYCNVAPLVPDSMTLTSLQFDGSKMKTDQHFSDASGERDRELKGMDNTYSTILSKYLPNMHGVGLGLGVGLLGIPDLSIVQGLESSSSKPLKLKSACGTGSLGDPIEVSDDSNEDELLNRNNTDVSRRETNSVDELLHKSCITQPINLQQQFESPHPYSFIANSSLSPMGDSKQLKKMAKGVQPIKINQLESSSPLQSFVPPSSTSSFNINFIGNDKFSLAGGADLIPLSCIDSGLSYSSKTVPFTSLAAGATSESLVQSHVQPVPAEHKFASNFGRSTVNYDDITIIPTTNKSANELKLHKLHKKPKKPKEGKIKKKKDKKDKTRNKEKCEEKNILKADKPKGLDKKLKKEKKKEKLVPPDMLQQSTDNIECSTHQTKNIDQSSGLGPVAVTITETFQTTASSQAATAASTPSPAASQSAAGAALAPHLRSPKLELSPNQVPKLTLKLGGKSTPIPSNKFEGDHNSLLITPTTTARALTPTLAKREHSPELARFSPLVTGPPKPKPCEGQILASSLATPVPTFVPVPLPVSAPSQIQAVSNLSPNVTGLELGTGKAGGLSAPSNSWMSPASVPPISSTSSTATLSASSVLLPQQLLQAASQSISKIPLASFSSASTQNQQLVTTTKPEGLSLLPAASTESNRPSSYVDAEGYRIWICPACGKVDDGSAMIGCDGCDAWYHWICVGIFVAPNDNEDWFCRVCVTKKKVNGPDKKKKRNKKK